MSNPSRSQQRFPFRTPVRVHRNYRKLSPIKQIIRPIEQQENEPTKSSLSVSNVEIRSDTPVLDPREFWVKLRKHIANESLVHNDDHGNQHTPNKVVRIFVSSTFTDFFNEREVLIKKVFPALREQMEPSGIQIIDCDLRWGVPKDSTTEQTILTCLEELDRCFEDNGQPFFIGLISDKYGWVPKLSELPTKISEQYRWIDGASITLMEFIHGAFRRHNPNAFFLIRKSENILKNLPDKYTDKFVDKDELSQKQIKELKSQLPQMFSEEQIYKYDCFYHGLDSSSGRERVKIDGLQEFEEQAKKFLIQAIEKWYPTNFDTDISLNTEQKQMKTFLLNKTQFYVDRPEEYSMLLKYITGDHKDLTLKEGSTPVAENTVPMMSITGRSGDGKTILLGKLALDIEERMEGKYLFFYHFLDGAFHANANHFMYNALAQKLDKYLEENSVVSPTTGERPKITEDTFLSDAVALLPIPLIIIVDGLDKGDVRQQRNYKEQFPFPYLSSLRSDHTYILLSCETKSSLYETIYYYSHYELELKPLVIEQRRLYIEKFFRRFNKTLEREQESLLLNNKGGEHPVYLSYICENLRQFGDYSLVTKRLLSYPQTTDDLLDVLVDEIYANVDNPLIIDAFFKLLIISNVGIIESDIVNVLQYYMDKNTNENNKIAINPMVWSTLRRNMKTFLDTAWVLGHQLVIFRHSSLEQKLQKRFFQEDTNEMRILHGFMAEFFVKYPSIKDFASIRVAYHYDQAHMYKELVTYLRSSQSREVVRADRQAYLRKHRCTKFILPQDSVMAQRAYICNNCAVQFKLGPYTMSKSSCFICTNMIMGGNMPQTAAMRREARVCQKHGSVSYPHSIQCVACKSIRPKPAGTAPSYNDPVPLNICFECWAASNTSTRCCALELD